MAGEYTQKVEDYTSIIKSNDIVTDDGEIIENISKKSLENIAMDFINMEEQKKQKTGEILQWKKEKTEMQEYTINNCGHFYFNFYNQLLDKLQPQYLVRFIYLCCYMNYENILVINKSTRQYPIYEEDLQSILRLSRSEYYNTKKEFTNFNLIIFNEDKTISINNTYCKKGDIMKKNKSEKVRMFENGIKDIYENSKPSEHKALGLLFEILPKINLRWNVVCHNPEEEMLEKIQPYSLKDLAKELEQTNVTRFKKETFRYGSKGTICSLHK